MAVFCCQCASNVVRDDFDQVTAEPYSKQLEVATPSTILSTASPCTSANLEQSPRSPRSPHSPGGSGHFSAPSRSPHGPQSPSSVDGAAGAAGAGGAASPASPLGSAGPERDRAADTAEAEAEAAQGLAESSLPEDVAEVLREAARELQSGWPFKVEANLHELLQRLEQEARTEDAEQLRHTKVYKDLVAKMTEANELLGTLLDDEGWTCQKEADSIHVWTKPEPGTDLVTVRMAGIVEGPFDHFNSIGKELQLVKTWMTGVKTSYVVKKLNEFDQVGYYCWKVPLISAREFLIEETTLINDSEGYLLVKRVPPAPRPGLELPEIQKHHVRAAITNWCSFCAPVGMNEQGQRFIFAVTVMNIDLKMPLPSRLINHFSVAVGFQSFQQMRTNVKRSLDASSPLYASVVDPENASYYGRMRALEKAREARPIAVLKEVLETGWIKDPKERRKLFGRSEGVLVPMT